MLYKSKPPVMAAFLGTLCYGIIKAVTADKARILEIIITMQA
jgi:hypothetical protein